MNPTPPDIVADTELEHTAIVVEAALLAAPEPLTLSELRRLFDGEVGNTTLRAALAVLDTRWLARGIELAEVADGWRFQTRAEMQPYLARLRNDKPPRYSRAVMETLAIIAYRQPVTRGDIEEIRGVAVNPAIVKTLEERGWIEVVGHRDTPGKPALFSTTGHFLSDLNLKSLAELPPLDQLGELVAPGGAPGEEPGEEPVAVIEIAGAVSTISAAVIEIARVAIPEND